MGMYYKTCPRCGANLDPGERCECADRRLEPGETAKATPPGRGYRPKILLADTLKAERLAVKAYVSQQ